jgi:hypothetical protein
MYYISNTKKELLRVKEYDAKNKERKKEYQKNYYNIIKENKKEYRKKYIQINKEEIKIKQKSYKDTYKERRNKLRNERKQNNPLYKLSENIRSSIYRAINNNGYKKESRTYEILGCSFEHFKEYIESCFIEDKAWMNWENYGNPKDGIFEPNKSWDIDHIIPVSSFNTEQELLELNHYTNLQPLCSYTNRFIKRDTI